MIGDSHLRKLRTELGSAGKFAIVGIAATLTHAAVATSLLESNILSAFPANTGGFISAFCVSFAGHYYWSFSHIRSERGMMRAMARFLVVALSGFALNTAILALWLQLTPWPELVGILFAIAIVPGLTFAAARLWAFSHKPQSNEPTR